MKKISLFAIAKDNRESIFTIELDAKKRLANHMKELNSNGFDNVKFYPVNKQPVILELPSYVSKFKLLKDDK